MADFQIAWNPTTKVATVQAKGDAVPAGSTKIDEFTHADVEPAVADLEFDVNHVLFHHVRDALYHVGQLDMQIVTIAVDIEYVAVTGLSIAPPTVSRTVGQTQQMTPTWTPTTPSNTGLTYVSSDPTKATVSNTGLITAVAAGTATITATSVDGAFSDTTVVTVT